MSSETLGASFSIDVTALKAGLAQANRLIRESESEFKAAAAGMDNWSDSQEGVEARLKHLNTATELQQKKIAALQSEYDRLIAEGLDPTSAEAVKLRTDINKETEALNKNEAEIRKQTKALADMTDEGNETLSAADALRKKVEEQTAELDDLQEEYLNTVLTQGKFSKEAIALQKDIDKLSGELDANTRKLGETGGAAEDAGDGFTVAKGAVASFIGNGLSALVGACKDAIGNLLGLAESTREYRTIMASLENSSAQAGYTIAETEASFKQLNGVLGDTQAAATTTANLQAIGLEQSKLQELTNGVIGAWARYGDSIPIDGLGEAVNHTIQLGEVQGNLADVIEWSGGTVDDFNNKLAKCSTEAERADLIQKMLAEQGLTEAGEAWQKNNQSIVDANNAQAEYEKNTATLGEKIEPITTKVREGFNLILEKVIELINGVDLEAFGQTIEGAFAWFVDTALPAISGGLQWIIDNKDVLIAGIAGIGAAMLTMNVANMIMGVVNAFKAFKAAQEGATVAQWLLNVAMNANPIGLIVAAIAGLVTAFVLLWNNCEGFRNFWIGLWDGIKNAAKAVADWFVTAFNSVASFFDNFGAKVKSIFSNLWNNIKSIFTSVATWFNNTVIQPVANFFTNMWTNLKNGASQAWQGIKNAFSSVATFFGDVFGKAWTAIKNVFSNFGSFFSGLWNTIKTTFSNLGTNIASAIGGAVKSGINGVIKMIENTINGAIGLINGAIGLINKLPGVSVGKVDKLSLPRLAKGGIVESATAAIIGEDGAEAVVPLEKNTGWIKKLAKEIAAEQGQGLTVNQNNYYKQAYTSRKEKYKAKQELYAAARLVKAGAI